MKPKNFYLNVTLIFCVTVVSMVIMAYGISQLEILIRLYL